MADSIDELFVLPLDEFTAARNRLAKTQPEAKEIAKPSVPAWAVNQLARRHGDLIDLLVASSEAQLRAVQGQGDLRAAQADERHALAELKKQAATVLAESGRPASAAMLDRVTATLSAGVQTAEGRELLRSGRLTEELEPAGFAALAGITPAAPVGKARRRPAGDERRARKLREQAKELDAKARTAEREANRAEAAANRARAAARRARQRADEAAKALADLG